MMAAGLGSALLLLAAFGFQALGYAPCQMCLWQRWPHAAAAFVGGLATLGVAAPPVAAAGALSALGTAGIGIFHSGVERGWWPGPDSCSGGGDLGGLTGADLLSTEGATAIVMCDEVAWSFAGLSMASWNAVASLGLAAIWIVALARRTR